MQTVYALQCIGSTRRKEATKTNAKLIAQDDAELVHVSPNNSVEPAHKSTRLTPLKGSPNKLRLQTQSASISGITLTETEKLGKEKPIIKKRKRDGIEIPKAVVSDKGGNSDLGAEVVITTPKVHGGRRNSSGRKKKERSEEEKADVLAIIMSKEKEKAMLIRLAYVLNVRYKDSGQTFIQLLLGVKSEEEASGLQGQAVCK